MENKFMSYDDFMDIYRPHIGETPRRIDRTRGGSDNYTLIFPSGDVYTHDEILKPDATIHRFGFYSDDFTYVNCWNGVRIESYTESAERKNTR